MTRNEAIAAKMGWKLIDHFYINGSPTMRYVDSRGFLIPSFGYDISTDMGLAKILQAKMVEDGWDVHISCYPKLNNPSELFVAYIGNYGFETVCTNESAAIVELFCKVYEIKEE